MCQGALPSILRGTLNSVSVARLADQCQCLTHQYWFLTSTVTLICHHSAEQSAFSRADKASTLLFALLSDNFGDWSIVDTDSFLEKTLFNMQIAQWEVHREGLQLLCKSTGFISCMHRLSQSQTCLLEMILTYYILEQTVCWKFSSSIVLGRVGEGMLNQ